MTAAFAYPLRELGHQWLVYRRSWRGSIVIGLVNPLLFLTGIGIGIGRLVDANHATLGVSYLSFLAPGMIAASAMQMAFTGGAFQVFFQAQAAGSYTYTVATPLSPRDIMIGQQLFSSVRVGLLSAGFFVIQVALGAAESWMSLLTVPAAVLTGLAFSAPAAAWAIGVRDFRHIRTFFRFVIQPLYLLSGTFFPLSTQAHWVQTLAYASPLWHGVELCRTLNFGTATLTGSLVHLGYLLLFVVAGLVVGSWRFRRRLHA